MVTGVIRARPEYGRTRVLTEVPKVGLLGSLRVPPPPVPPSLSVLRSGLTGPLRLTSALQVPSRHVEVVLAHLRVFAGERILLPVGARQRVTVTPLPSPSPTTTSGAVRQVCRPTPPSRPVSFVSTTPGRSPGVSCRRRLFEVGVATLTQTVPSPETLGPVPFWG